MRSLRVFCYAPLALCVLSTKGKKDMNPLLGAEVYMGRGQCPQELDYLLS